MCLLLVFVIFQEKELVEYVNHGDPVQVTRHDKKNYLYHVNFIIHSFRIPLSICTPQTPSTALVHSLILVFRKQKYGASQLNNLSMRLDYYLINAKDNEICPRSYLYTKNYKFDYDCYKRILKYDGDSIDFRIKTKLFSNNNTFIYFLIYFRTYDSNSVYVRAWTR